MILGKAELRKIADIIHDLENEDDGSTPFIESLRLVDESGGRIGTIQRDGVTYHYDSYDSE